jgi:hypothetical protein
MSERTAVKRLGVRHLQPQEILSEEEACIRDHPAFPPPWETAVTELCRRYLRTRARLRNVFVGPLQSQSLLVQTPRGLAVTWRLWGETLQVVHASLLSESAIALEPGVIDIPASQVAHCQFLVDRILTELPPWSH